MLPDATLQKKILPDYVAMEILPDTVLLEKILPEAELQEKNVAKLCVSREHDGIACVVRKDFVRFSVERDFIRSRCVLKKMLSDAVLQEMLACVSRNAA